MNRPIILRGPAPFEKNRSCPLPNACPTHLLPAHKPRQRARGVGLEVLRRPNHRSGVRFGCQDGLLTVCILTGARNLAGHIVRAEERALADDRQMIRSPWSVVLRGPPCSVWMRQGRLREDALLADILCPRQIVA